MRFQKGDLIDDKYLVVDSMMINNREYVCVHFDDTQNTFLEVAEENNEVYIKNIENDEEFKYVMNQFANKAKESLEKIVNE